MDYNIIPYIYNFDVSEIEFIKKDNNVYMYGKVVVSEKGENTNEVVYIRTPESDSLDLFHIYEFDLRPFNGEHLKIYTPKQNNDVIIWFMKCMFGDYDRKYVYDGEIWDKIKELGLINIDYVDHLQRVQSGNSFYYKDFDIDFKKGNIYIKRNEGRTEFYRIHIKHFLNMDFELLSDYQLIHLNENYLYNSDYKVFNARISNKLNRYRVIDEIDKIKILNNFLKYRIKCK